MAAAGFVLSPYNVVDWQGATGKQVKISVGPAGPGLEVLSVEYPAGTVVAAPGGIATLTILAGQHELAMTIKTVIPALDWSLVEVGPAGTNPATQSLDDVDSSDPVPYYTSVQIHGV